MSALPLKAVILAAGAGNRISTVAKDTPKPLLTLDGTGAKDAPTFLDWHLWSLAKAGAKEIYIVGNKKTYQTKLVAERDVKVTWILNPTDDLGMSGSGHSTQYAWHSEHNILDGKSRVILMDADILYDPSIYDLLTGASGLRSKTLVCGDYRETNEEVMVFARKETPMLPSLHGKGLLETALTNGAICLGEATGILLWEPDDHAALRSVTDWVIRFSTAKARSEHEDLTQRMMALGLVECVSFGRDVPFMECDTPEEYSVLTSEMYPRLRAKLGL